MKCPTNSQPQQPKNGTPQGSKIAKQVFEFYEDLRTRGGVLTEKNTIEAQLQREFGILVNSSAHIPTLTKYSKVQNILATVLGYKSTVLGAIDLSMNEAGATRYLLQSKAREAAKVLQLAAVTKALPKVSELYGELQKALPNLTKDKIQTILHDHVLIGQFPTLHNIYDSPVVRAQLAQRYQEHTARLVANGVSPENIKSLDILAGEISQSFDNARLVAGKYGLDVKALQNGGYFPLQVQEGIKKLLDGANEASRSSASKVMFDTAAVLSASRTSTMPIVLDTAKAAKVLGLKEVELATLLTEPGGISSYLRKKFSPDEIDKLFNNGTLTQVPALSDELTTFFSEELDLPIEGIAEALILDPVKAIKNYNAELTKAVENSAMVQTALDEGLKHGWVVDYHSLKGTEEAKNYVKLGSDKLFQELFRKEQLREGIADLFVHRTVADQLKALTEASTSFTSIGLIGSGLQSFLKFTGFTKRSLISAAGLPYISRVFLQNAISLQASTGSHGMFQYANGLAEVMRTVVNKNGIDKLGTEAYAKVAGKDYSLKELFEATFLRRGDMGMSITGESIERGSADKLMDRWDKQSRDRFFAQMAVYHQRYGSPITGKIQDRVAMAAEVANNTSKFAYEQLAKANQFLDFAARWTSVRTLAKDPSLAGRKEWKDLDELLRYTDEYFNVNSDLGQAGKVGGQFLIPFASFALAAPGVTLRHAIRHPWRYARAMSLYAQTNANSDLTDAELADWQKNSYPVFLGRDYESGKRWAINPGTVDSFLDTTTWAKQNFEKVGRALGANVGSAKEQIEAKINPTADYLSGINDIMQKTYFGKPLLALEGINPQTGEKFPDVGGQDTLLGVSLPIQIRATLTEMLPVLKSLDSKWLPSSIVGEAPVQDPLSFKMLRGGKPGFLGNVPTTGGRAKGNELEKAGVIGWIAQTGGLTLSQFDPKSTLINNYRDFGFRISDLKNAVNSIDVKLNSRPVGAETPGLKEQRLRLLQFQGLLEYNQQLVNNLAIKKGYPMPVALELLRKTLATAKDIPQEEKMEFIKQYTPEVK